MIDFPLILESLPSLLHGVLLSLLITFISTSIGFTLGPILGLAHASKYRAVALFASIYVTLFRGTPMLIQILFIYYALPQLGISIEPIWAAGIAIGLNSCAYVSQVIRSGINAIPKGQLEAAHTLGFSTFGVVRFIVLPQAFRTTLPALGNELVTLVKDSSLASFIGVMELTKEASVIRSRTYDAFSILLAVALLYLLLTSTLSFCLKYYANKVGYHAENKKFT